VTQPEPDVEANPDVSDKETDGDDDDDYDWNLFKLLRSYSLPNLSTTPIEDLFMPKAAEPEESGACQEEAEAVHPVVMFEDEDGEDQVR
jgi:hypothetical protein